MPPIPIYKNDPIHPAAEKAKGITPETADSSNLQPTRTIPAQVPATTTADSSNPPAPQPGARPAAPTGGSMAAASNSSLDPPAPQAGPTATHITTETRLGGPPQQFTMPPPSDSQLAGRSTITSTTASKVGPTTVNMGPVASPFQTEDSHGGSGVPGVTGGEERRSLEHPPGYVQAHNNTYNSQDGSQAGNDEGSVGAAAWNLLSKAGDALQKGEEAAWRAVRNK